MWKYGLLLLILIAACSPAVTPTPTEPVCDPTEEATLTLSPTFTLTSTLTVTPSPTFTPSLTPTTDGVMYKTECQLQGRIFGSVDLFANAGLTIPYLTDGNPVTLRHNEAFEFIESFIDEDKQLYAEKIITENGEIGFVPAMQTLAICWRVEEFANQ